MNSDLITVSRMRCFNSCRRLHHIKYELGYRSLTTSESLSFGTLIHTALEAWWKSGGSLPVALEAMRAKPGDADAIAMAKAVVLITGYDARWLPDMADFEVLGVEVEFRARIRKPRSEEHTSELQSRQ